MPKMKSKRAAAKRFRVLGSGKIKCRKANRSHLLSNRSKKRKKNLASQGYVDETQEHQVRRMLPYSF